MHLPSYSSPYAIGHRAIADLLKGPVLVQEKVDGSQISFGLGDDGELSVRSKGALIHVDAPDKMFSKAIEFLKTIKHLLIPGYVYRGEYLRTPKHNALQYDRTPNNHIVLFDVEDTNQGEAYYLRHEILADEAKRIGLEAVPVFHFGEVAHIDNLGKHLERTSFLGGPKIEGIVVKNYAIFTPDKKVAMGKWVSEDFKEVHAKEWGESNPSQNDIVQRLIAGLRTDARWNKGIQHLRDAGKLTDTPKDIGLLIREVQEDVTKECSQEVADVLLKHFFPTILRGVVAGLPEFYKKHLADMDSIPG